MSIDPSTIKPGGKVSVPVSILYTSCHLTLTDAPKVEDYKGNNMLTPIVAVWTATLYDWHVPGVYDIRVALYSDVKGESANYDQSNVPEWVPRPPDGWDLGVRIHAERLAGDAEGVSR